MTSPRLFIAPLPTLSAGGVPIRKVLVANRGEIACRIIRTCALLGLETAAIYSDLHVQHNTSTLEIADLPGDGRDADAPHVALATQAVFVGSSIPPANAGSEFTSPYLKGEELVKLAKAIGADAVHPGRSEARGLADAVKLTPAARQDTATCLRMQHSQTPWSRRDSLSSGQKPRASELSETR